MPDMVPAPGGTIDDTVHQDERVRPRETAPGGAAEPGTKVAAMARHRDRHQHRPMERLTQPLVRDHGVLRPASWEEALDRAADGLRTARDTYGGRSIGMFSCSKSTNELNFVAQKVARAALGTNNIDSCNRT
jgi:formate dehydrogenase major subunit